MEHAMSLFRTKDVPIFLTAFITIIATNSAIADELCFLNSLGCVYYCPAEGGIPGEGADGFSTPDQDPCPDSPAATNLTISASDTDPYLTHAPLPPSQTSLYLWHVSTSPLQAELSHLFCDVVGDIPVIGFDSQYVHDLSTISGSHWSLYVSFGCDVGFGSYQVLLGELQLEAPTPVSEGSWGGIKAIYR
jgi:hypothetical protein